MALQHEGSPAPGWACRTVESLSTSGASALGVGYEGSVGNGKEGPLVRHFHCLPRLTPRVVTVCFSRKSSTVSTSDNYAVVGENNKNTVKSMGQNNRRCHDG